MKKNELVAKAKDLGIQFDESKVTVETLKSLIEDWEVEVQEAVNKMPTIIEPLTLVAEPLTLAEVIENTITSVIKTIETKTAKLEKDKKAGNDNEGLSMEIKSLKTKVKDLTILSHLHVLQNTTVTTEYFKEITENNKLGQYFNFNLDYAKKLVTVPEGLNFNKDFSAMNEALTVIQSIIKTIDGAELYEKIHKDILPRYTNDESIIDFADCKKAIESFVKANSNIFASGMNVCINNDDAKTFIAALLKIRKSNARNTINMVLFNAFLNEFQGMIATKVNKLNLKIALMKKSK